MTSANTQMPSSRAGVGHLQTKAVIVLALLLIALVLAGSQGSQATTSSMWDDCFMCHTSQNPAYPIAQRYPATHADAGFPYAETWPGRVVFDGSPHSRPSVVWPGSGLPGGDCRNCHSTHMSPSGNLESLRSVFRSPKTFPTATSYDAFTLCYEQCHDSDGPGPDVAQYYKTSDPYAGHRLDWNPSVVDDTSGAYLPQGAQMPCYECHGIHGSSNGNYKLFTDERGGGVTNTKTFCTKCHRPSDSVASTPTVAGLPLKKLPATVDLHATGGDSDGCACHGNAHEAGGHAAASDCLPCHGTTGSHAIHLDPNDKRGPRIYCTICHRSGDFPYFASGNDANGNGHYELSETDVCDECHSPGGDYDGVDDPSIGAKPNWAAKAYETTTTLKAGKEKWCVGCHDGNESVPGGEPSRIGGVYAPPVAGDENASYTYGTGWGFYETGHGKTGGPIPSNGVDPGPGLECDACHNYAEPHVDGDRRTFTSTGSPVSYRTSYRLDRVGGQEPMLIPWPGMTGNSLDNYRLCTQGGCHDVAPSPFTNAASRKTNFWNDARADIGYNMHTYHLGFTNNMNWWPDWGTSRTSRITCPTCHNVHGTTRLAMIQDGSLISDTQNRRNGLEIFYHRAGVTSWGTLVPPSPADVTLAMSDGWVWYLPSGDKICVDCHGGNWDLDSRATWRSYAGPPVLAWAGVAGYESDGANPDSGPGPAGFTFRIKYSDPNNDPPDYIDLLIDKNDDGDFLDVGERVAMTADNALDTTYYNGNNYSVTTPLAKAGDNVISYHFETRAVGDTVMAPASRTVTITNSAPTMPWTGETGFVGDGVNPNSGTTDLTNYEFRIVYRDLDGEAPSGGAPTLYLDRNDDGDFADPGESIAMTDMGDPSFITGKRFRHFTTITRQGDDTIAYRFGASDGIDAAQTATQTVTVIQNINFAPVLAWTAESGYEADGSNPDNQAGSKPFYFRVQYTDANNDAPGVKQVWVDLDDNGAYGPGEKFPMDDLVTASDPAMTDGVYTNGEIFAKKVYVPFVGDGTIKYCFYFEDTSAAEATGVHLVDKTLSVYSARIVRNPPGPGEYSTIQAAVNAASAGETVLVTDGTWAKFVFDGKDIIVESVNDAGSTIIQGGAGDYVVEFNSWGGGGSDSTVRGFTIRGGARGIQSNASNAIIQDCIIENNSSYGIYHTSTSSDPIVVERTTIRNNGYGIQTTNASAIVTLRDSSISASTWGGLISAGGNCTIERSTIEGNTNAGNGGGAYFSGTVNPLTITDSVIRNNTGGQGGGIYVNGNASCVANIQRTQFSGNTANGGVGGALYIGQGTYTYVDVTFSGNTASTSGGGVYANNSWSTYTRCVFTGNRANSAGSNGGGGHFTNGGNASFTNSLFAGNYAAYNGGGAWTQNNVNPLNYVNCTFAGNRAGNLGGGMYVNSTFANTQYVRNTIMHGDDAVGSTTREEIDGGASYTNMVVQYTDINQDYSVFAGQTGNLNTTPQFVDPRLASVAPTSTGDYHLQTGSPCEGKALYEPSPTDDIDRDSRPQGTGKDMGYDEIVPGGGSMLEGAEPKWLSSPTAIQFGTPELWLPPTGSTTSTQRVESSQSGTPTDASAIQSGTLSGLFATEGALPSVMAGPTPMKTASSLTPPSQPKWGASRPVRLAELSLGSFAAFLLLLQTLGKAFGFIRPTG